MKKRLTYVRIVEVRSSAKKIEEFVDVLKLLQPFGTQRTTYSRTGKLLSHPRIIARENIWGDLRGRYMINISVLQRFPGG